MASGDSELAFGILPSDRRFKLRRAKFPVMAQALAEEAGRIGRAPRVLDAGLGQCKLERLFAHQHPEVEVDWYGLDLLDFRLRLRLDVGGIRRVQGNVEALPFANEVFDAVVCSYVLQHLAHPERALSELARSLRPGGLLLAAVPNSPQPLKALNQWVQPRWIAYRRRRKGKAFSYLPQIQFYNLPRVRALVTAAGLEPVRWQGLGFATGGPLRPLENLEWYYRLNLRLGALFPRATQDLVCMARKPPLALPGPTRGG